MGKWAKYVKLYNKSWERVPECEGEIDFFEHNNHDSSLPGPMAAGRLARVFVVWQVYPFVMREAHAFDQFKCEI